MAVVMVARLIQDNGFEKVALFYQLLHKGSTADNAFRSAFRAPMDGFLNEMNGYFNRLRSRQ